MVELDGAQRARLRSAIATYFSGRRVGITWGGDVVIETRTGREWGLASLAQLAASTPEDHWTEMVQRHFDSIAALDVAIPERFEEAAPRLRVRLGPRPPNISMYIWRRVTAGLVETLMLQLHGAARNVPPERIAGWDVDPEVVWKKARDNTLWDDPVERELMISPTGGRVVHVTGGFFASSRLLVLDRYLPVRRRQGALAILPRRHSLLYIEVGEWRRLYKDLEALLELGNRFYVEGPGSSTRDVFWWRAGEIRRLMRAGRSGLSIVGTVADDLIKALPHRPAAHVWNM
jgi:hypothetical protein